MKRKQQSGDKAIAHAFSLYLQGLSGQALLEEVHRYYPDVTSAQLDCWRTDHDWQNRRTAADARNRELVDQGAAEPELAVIVRCLGVMDELKKGIGQSPVNHHLYYAQQNLSATVLEAAEQRESRIHPRRISREVAAAMLEEFVGDLRDIAVLRPSLLSVAPAVQSVVDRLLEKYGR